MSLQNSVRTSPSALRFPAGVAAIGFVVAGLLGLALATVQPPAGASATFDDPSAERSTYSAPAQMPDWHGNSGRVPSER